MSKKPKTEYEMRRDILYNAKILGCYSDALKIIERYDNLLKNCPNPEERYQIGVMGAAEMHKLLECKRALMIRHEGEHRIILPADPNFKEPE